MGYKESRITNDIRLRASQMGIRLFRNNVGLFQTLTGVKVRTGLAIGSADLIGWASFERTQDNVPFSIFTSIEVKTKSGTVTNAQKNWSHRVAIGGGIALVVRSVRDFETSMQGVLNSWEKRGMRLVSSGG